MDLEAVRLYLDDKRRAKWAGKLRAALDSDRLSIERVLSMHGIMQRACLPPQPVLALLIPTPARRGQQEPGSTTSCGTTASCTWTTSRAR